MKTYVLITRDAYSTDLNYARRKHWLLWLVDTKQLFFVFEPHNDFDDVDLFLQNHAKDIGFVKGEDRLITLNGEENIAKEVSKYDIPFSQIRKYSSYGSFTIYLNTLEGFHIVNLPPGITLDYLGLPFRSGNIKTYYDRYVKCITVNHTLWERLISMYSSNYLETFYTYADKYSDITGLPLCLISNRQLNYSDFIGLIKHNVGIYDVYIVTPRNLKTFQITANLKKVPVIERVYFVFPEGVNLPSYELRSHNAVPQFNLIDLSKCKGIFRKVKNRYYNVFLPRLLDFVDVNNITILLTIENLPKDFICMRDLSNILGMYLDKIYVIDNTVVKRPLKEIQKELTHRKLMGDTQVSYVMILV